MNPNVITWAGHGLGLILAFYYDLTLIIIGSPIIEQVVMLVALFFISISFVLHSKLFYRKVKA